MAAAIVGLSGCASTWHLQMMSRDSGKVYSGIAQGDGSGGGSVTVTIEDRSYTGPAVRTAANESFGFFQTYGRGGLNAVGSTQSFGGTVYDNSGLRCDLTGDGHGHLGGICLNDKGRVYDVVASR